MRFVGTGIGEDAAGSSSIHRRLTPPRRAAFRSSTLTGRAFAADYSRTGEKICVECLITYKGAPADSDIRYAAHRIVDEPAPDPKKSQGTPTHLLDLRGFADYRHAVSPRGIRPIEISAHPGTQDRNKALNVRIDLGTERRQALL